MYVNPEPSYTYGETQAWKMPSPQPAGTLRRPPVLKSGSSSSSLNGMEQTIPSFESFVKRTPPPNAYKPLPPTPLQPRRASSFAEGSPRPPSSRLSRRSSSIYSRNASVWEPEANTPSWRTADLADQTNMLLRPIAYSASTSQLASEQLSPQLLQDRTYDPLIDSPSPSISRERSPSPKSPESRPSVLLPPLPAPVRPLRKHLRTVSLEQAKRAVNAPGAVHLLPEELRAQALGKSKTQQRLRISSLDIMAGRTSPESPEAPTLVDSQGRERLIEPLRISQVPSDDSAFSSSPADLPDRKDLDAFFGLSTGSLTSMAPLASQARKQSRAKAAQALGLEDVDEARGRTRTRTQGPRNLSYDHYLPKPTRLSDASDSHNNEYSDAQKIANEYHNLLSHQYRTASDSPTSNRTESDTEVKSQMKLVPQPLFHNKPPAKLPGAAFRHDSKAPSSVYHQRMNSVFGNTVPRRSGSSRGSFPLRLSLSSRSHHRRRSTSGTIPISPPTASLSGPAGKLAGSPAAALKPSPKPRRKSDDGRVSAYYPHVMSRRGRKARDQPERPTPPPPMLAADVIAERSKTPESTPDLSTPASDLTSHSGPTPEDADRSLAQRMKRGAAGYADLLTRPAESFERRRTEDVSPMGRVAASPESPHLLPSPVLPIKPPPTMHLGWSDAAKSTFDKARSSVRSRKKSSDPLVLITHSVTPARPLNGSVGGLTEEPESPGLMRRGSIFSGMMDSWRESKAQKRRQELKKLIKVVTPEAQAEEQREESARPGVGERRLSAFNWV